MVEPRSSTTKPFSERESRLDRLDQSLLEHLAPFVPRGARKAHGFHAVTNGLFKTPFRPRDAGRRCEEAAAVLYVRRLPVRLVLLQKPARLRHVSTAHADLEDTAQKAQRERLEQTVFGDLTRALDRLVPAPLHEERVRDLRQDAPLAGSRAAAACERKRSLEVSERIVVAITLERDVGEVEERVVLLIEEPVLTRDRE